MSVHHFCMPVKGPDGTVYPSQVAAASALGVSPRTIGYHLDLYGNLNRLGRIACRLNAPRRREIAIAGRSWASVALFADYLGCKPSTVRNWVRRGDMNKIVAALMKADAQQRRAA